MHVFFPKRISTHLRLVHLFSGLIPLMSVILLAACTPTGTSGNMQSPQRNQTFQISINDFNFQPNEITLPVGSTVEWKVTGQNPHTITADDNSFKSGTLTPGAIFKYTFTKVGTYLYYCEFHGYKGGQGMAGAVTVVSSGSGSIPSVFIAFGKTHFIDRLLPFESGSNLPAQ